MAIQSELVRIRKKFRKRFPDTDLHHPIPTSRIPRNLSEEKQDEIRLIVFPYDADAHDASHHLLSNLRIDQIWMMLEPIHRSIFETVERYIQPWWIVNCELESGDYKQRTSFEKSKRFRFEKLLEIKQLRSLWSRAFGGEDPVTAQNILEIMMLFMVFGEDILDKDTLFDNGNLQHFFENSLPEGYRQWASNTLFGGGGSVHGVRSKLVNILSKNDFYSSRIL